METGAAFTGPASVPLRGGARPGPGPPAGQSSCAATAALDRRPRPIRRAGSAHADPLAAKHQIFAEKTSFLGRRPVLPDCSRMAAAHSVPRCKASAPDGGDGASAEAPPGAPEAAAPAASETSPPPNLATPMPSPTDDTFRGTDIIICHQRVDFDSLGAAIGLSRLRTLLMLGPKALGTKTKRNKQVRIVFTGGEDNSVKGFLSLYRNEFPLADWKTVKTERIKWIGVVDCQHSDRIGAVKKWLTLPDIEVEVYDHHMGATCDLPADELVVEPVGSSTTIIVERLRETAKLLGMDDDAIGLSIPEATAMALGVHADTGNLTFNTTTERDALALAWLIRQGASQREIATFQQQSLSPELQGLLNQALQKGRTDSLYGYTILSVVIRIPKFVHGAARIASTVMELTGADAVLLGAFAEEDQQLSIVGRARARIDGIDLAKSLGKWRGGGHPKAAAASVQDCSDPEQVLNEVVAEVMMTVARPPRASEIMSKPVYTVLSSDTMAKADELMAWHGCTGLVVLSDEGEVVGTLTARDVQTAELNNLLSRPIKAFMNRQPITIDPETSLHEIEKMLTTNPRLGRLPVRTASGKLVGVVTRSDVLRTRLDEPD
eukprot:tig00000821_g4522.t1